MNKTTTNSISSGGTLATPGLSWPDAVSNATGQLSQALETTLSGLEKANSSAVMGIVNEDTGVLPPEDTSEGTVPRETTSSQDEVAEKLFQTIVGISPTLELPKMLKTRSEALWRAIAAEIAADLM